MNKVAGKNFFDYCFDSFELDDGFLSKLDAEVKSKEKKGPQISTDFVTKTAENVTKEKLIKNKNDTLLPFKNLSESDFLDFDSKAASPSNKSVHQRKELQKAFTNCVSPIHGSSTTKNSNNHSFSSTPIRSNLSNKENGKILQKFENHFFEADLFEDWDNINFDEPMKMIDKDKDEFITLSQAVQLIEEESAKALEEEKEELNLSINLLTGEVYQTDIKSSNEFKSYQSKSPKEKQDKNKITFNKNVEKPSKENTETKSLAAYKLNFSTELPKNKSPKVQIFCISSDDDDIFCEVGLSPKLNNNIYKKFNPPSIKSSSSDDNFSLRKRRKKARKLNFSTEEVPKKQSPKLQDICFSSDDDDIFCEVGLSPKLNKKSLETKKSTLINNTSSDNSFDMGIKVKQKILAIESDSPDYKAGTSFCKKNKKLSGRSRHKGKQYIVSEVEVSDEVEVSSDEIEEDNEEYEKSFVDENSYCTQNNSANMTAKYLESLKNLDGGVGNFKIPKPKPYNPFNIFSQVPEEGNTDYEIDSFCVADCEDEIRTDLSDLEVAEKVLEMDRKKRKKKRAFRKSRKK